MTILISAIIIFFIFKLFEESYQNQKQQTNKALTDVNNQKEQYFQELQKEKQLYQQEMLQRQKYQQEVLYLRQQIDAFITENSQSIADIKNLNSKWQFKNFEKKQRYKRECNSKTQFDNFNIDNHMLLTIEDSPDYFMGLVKAVEYNRKIYFKYENLYNDILNNLLEKYNKRQTNNSLIDITELKKIEINHCTQLKLNANVDFLIELIVCYKSPQGKNDYSKSFQFTYNSIKNYLEEFFKRQKNKQSSVYQRQLMTPKMRYNIMKRDGFKCVICGRSQNDGAKLHVDHIKPVSKGGKTEESNLRTLCDMCNLGKSDAYDPNGLN